MSFKDLVLKNGYRSNRDDILNDFYVPVLSESVRYDRIAGYFSSASLSVAARGITGLIRNGGRMRLITSPNLTDSDYEALKEYYNGQKEGIEKLLINNLDDLQDMFQRDHLQALCWMLDQDKLEIKIAIPKSLEPPGSAGLFHMKVGILHDQENNVLTFSGSINETASAWSNNREEFKVFLSYDDKSSKFSDLDIEVFDNIWNGFDDDIEVFSLPESVRHELVRKAPTNIEEIVVRISTNLSGESGTSMSAYYKLGLFVNQEEAVQIWFANDHRGIFEMATGTGKTRTAIGCILRLIEKKEVNIVIVSAPQNTILLQWIKEIEAVELKDFRYLVADSTNPQWRKKLLDELIFIQSNIIDHLMIFTTHITLSSNDFTDIFQNQGPNIRMMLVGDEVHGIGALESRKGMLLTYDYRLGLSATPKRWYDDIGSDLINEYFGEVVYSFPIEKALTEINPMTNEPYLTEYYYYPVFVDLTDSEFEEYKRITSKLSFYSGKDRDPVKEAAYERLLFKRANILKDAENKLKALIALINETKIENSIIYTSPARKNDVLQILKQHRIACHTYTEDVGTVPQDRFGGMSEREYIIKKFSEKKLSALVAIKCLDEGIDIPTADKAMIISSGGNPREYIQRIGRVIRKSKGKNHATIYDFIVTPRKKGLSKSEREVEKRIFRKEMTRAVDIANSAINSGDVIISLYSLLE